MLLSAGSWAFETDELLVCAGSPCPAAGLPERPSIVLWSEDNIWWYPKIAVEPSFYIPN
jgi:hypothetical protein